jgi:hypothetical protein
MKEELQKRLLESFDAIVNVVKTGASELPSVAQEYVRWFAMENGYCAAVCVVVFIASGVFTYYFSRWMTKNDGWEMVGVLLIPACGIIISSVVFFFKVQMLLKAIYAPRLIIIEYFAGFLR